MLGVTENECPEGEIAIKSGGGPLLKILAEDFPSTLERKAKVFSVSHRFILFLL